MKTIKVGTWIGFKNDVEQSAKVVEIKEESRAFGRVTIYVVEAPLSGFEGEYLSGLKFAEIYADEIF